MFLKLSNYLTKNNAHPNSWCILMSTDVWTQVAVFTIPQVDGLSTDTPVLGRHNYIFSLYVRDFSLVFLWFSLFSISTLPLFLSK